MGLTSLLLFLMQYLPVQAMSWIGQGIVEASDIILKGAIACALCFVIFSVMIQYSTKWGAALPAY